MIHNTLVSESHTGLSVIISKAGLNNTVILDLLIMPVITT